MSRLSRDRPLPDLQRVRVEDPSTQRGFDVLSNVMRAVLDFLQPFVQRDKWQALPYFTGWADDSATLQIGQMRKYPWGEIRLRGWVKTASGSSDTIAVLPIGWRPPARCSFDCFRLNGTYALARVDVDVDGRVLLVTPAVGAGDEVSLNGIFFDLE